MASNLEKRVAQLELQNETVKTGPVILLVDVNDEGEEATIAQWEAEHGRSIPDNSFKIILVSFKA